MSGAVAPAMPRVEDVFITDELFRRVPRRTDYLREKLALQDLAARMADQPKEVLPRFVDLALEMTGGVSAGLSLYESDATPGVFRWHYLRGLLAPFVGATTPRDFSPCGVTLDRNGPVLSTHPERVYDWIADAGIVVPEVLLVPLYLGGGTPLGTLWIVSATEGHFDSGDARAMTELASFVGIALLMVRTEERLQRALEEQGMLAREMSHRVKNLFSMIDAMIRISGRGAETKAEMVEMLSGRVHALASAHSLVRRSFSDGAPGARESDLDTLIRAIVQPHEAGTGRCPRFSIEGPFIACGDHAMNSLALIVHELTTNAAKYGALTGDEGRVDVTWTLEGDQLILRWTERGGLAIETAPTSSGFGSVLARAAVGQLGGTLHRDWHRTGLAVTITAPRERLAA